MIFDVKEVSIWVSEWRSRLVDWYLNEAIQTQQRWPRGFHIRSRRRDGMRDGLDLSFAGGDFGAMSPRPCQLNSNDISRSSGAVPRVSYAYIISVIPTGGGEARRCRRRRRPRYPRPRGRRAGTVATRNNPKHRRSESRRPNKPPTTTQLVKAARIRWWGEVGFRLSWNVREFRDGPPHRPRAP